MENGGGGREGDWECSSCSNKNYAFRSFCNRCKQSRILVDSKTPADSKWLPRIGDWICSGCTNNNYASRENCKKCGKPKEIAAIPALSVPGASNSAYFARAQPTNPYGLQPTSPWQSGFPSYAYRMNQPPPIPDGNGWRYGDWICICGFHNYSSRAQCKRCNAPTSIVTPSPLVNTALTAHGTKRLATDENLNLDSKRLNAGQQSYPGYELQPSNGGGQFNPMYPPIPNGNTSVAPNLPFNHQMMSAPATPTLLGKGAKQWRDGDWMCSNCNNHNYASRAQCNRCQSQRYTVAQPLGV